MKLHYQKYLGPYAQKLRKAGNLSEVLLWKEIKSDKLGCRFLRQRPIGDYVVDFYCPTLKLAVEIDGAATHDCKVEEDIIRQNKLESMGIRVVHFRDIDVRRNLSGVVLALREEILRRVVAPPPLRKEE